MPSAEARRARILPLVLLTGAVVFWGTSFAATKTALDSFAPMTVIWLRMCVAAIVIAPFLARIPRPRYRTGDWKLLAVSGLFIPCFYYLLEGYAIRFTTSSQAGVVSAVVPLLAAAGSMISIKRLTERYDAWFLTGM